MPQVKPKVTLIRHTEDAQQVVAASGKLCYAADTADLLIQNPDDAETFIKRVVKMGHLSILEHASFTFYVEGISRAMTHQLVRHRVASYSQRSQRYVDHEHFDYIVPPEFEDKIVEVQGKYINAVDYYKQTMEMIGQRYSKLLDSLGRQGEISNQDARYVLPNGCETKIFITMNARELLHFFEERTCMRAQWEIRNVANEMLKIVKEKCPAIFDGAGPKCVRLKKCPEGKKTCGKFQEMLEIYNE
ncbi:MAG: FAD-dependent thymidylate synthase [Phycisphaerae bacterium]|nr:FAD-dependent thymidylate synthase [Phycisphaerae bacterium]